METSSQINNLGDWRLVPEFNGELYASSLGWVQQMNVKTRGWYDPFQGSPHAVKGYMCFSHRGKNLRVHHLVALAFIGPQPTAAHTVDHLNKNRGDNRAENLRWATKSTQSENRNASVARRDGKGVLMWRKGSSKDTGLYFGSMLAAAKELGLHHPCIRKVAMGEQPFTEGYHAEFWNQEPDKICDDEEFRDIEGFFVSQYGRAKDVRTGAFSYTPKATRNSEYAMIPRGNGNGRRVTRTFHRLVASAWPEIVGSDPGNGETVDHINRDTSDNRAANLRWASGPLQATNQCKTNTEARKRKLGLAVELRAPGQTDWRSFVCLPDAVKATNAMYGTSLSQPLLSQSLKINARGRTLLLGKHKGWSIRAATT